MTLHEWLLWLALIGQAVIIWMVDRNARRKIDALESDVAKLMMADPLANGRRQDRTMWD